MKRRANPYPGVSRQTDRHGVTRWRFRKGGVDEYLPGPYGSEAFVRAYNEAREGLKTTERFSRATYGSFDWLIEQYLRNPRHHEKAARTQAQIRMELEWLRKQVGHLPFAKFGVRHVEAVMARKDGAAAANRVRKLLSMLFNFALAMEFEGVTKNPARYAQPRKHKSDGFYTMTAAEMRQFLTAHGPGTKARLVFLLAQNTGAGRTDLTKLTWNNIEGDRIRYRRQKTGVAMDARISRELGDELARVPRDGLVIISHSGGRAYKPESLANWFKDRCKEAGLPHCTFHSIRKGQATAIVDAGGSAEEVMAFLAHETPHEGATYTKKAARGRLADAALDRVSKTDAEQSLTNPSEKLVKAPVKPLKAKEN